MKFAYLHKVDPGANNNKFYKMQENADGTFTATYGREGAAKPATEVYPMSKWDTKYREKLSSKKGYTDVTDLRSITEAVSKVKTSTGEAVISKDKGVEQLIVALQNFARIQTAAVYKVVAAAVTQKQVDKAQEHINNLSYSFQHHFSKNWNINMFNTELVALFIVIPRKMKNVADHMITQSWTKEQIQELIANEQSNLDSMASQIPQEVEETEDTTTDVKPKEITLLETLGLDVSVVTDAKLLKAVKDAAQNHAHRIKNVYAVVNKATQSRYDAKLKNTTVKKIELLWHGSRVANWWFIIQQGLKIRPSGAVHSGSMFDDGVYFAMESDKSMGYTDSGRWVNNGSNISSVFMALYEVNLGKQKIVDRHDSSCYKLASYCKSNGYDSVHAKKGVSLHRDELIIYNSDQSTIKYLVEFRN